MTTEICDKTNAADQLPDSLRTTNEWVNIRHSLYPRFRVAWLSIGLTLVTLTSSIILTSIIIVNQNDWMLSIILAIIGAIIVGTVFAHLVLWFHEAAHFNIHQNKQWNDLLANVLIGSFVGQDIKKYRQIHFAHHRHLGDRQDPECSYFTHPGLGLIVSSLLGLQVLKTLASRRKSPSRPESNLRAQMMLFIGVGLHLAILTILSTYFSVLAALVWVMSVASIYPAINALRQSLEHRSPYIRPDHYGPDSGGAYTRTFNASLISRLIGGAGFRRHAIHHWDPTLSCTRFDDAEKYLEQNGYPTGSSSNDYISTLAFYLNKRVW